ncbi:hypothetical protein Bca4012_099411 [Brassica carinata]
MAWLLQVVGGSLLLVQRVIRLGMKLSALVGSSSLGSNPICVVCASSSFYHGGGVVVYAASVAACFASSPSDLLFAVPDLFFLLFLSDVGGSRWLVEVGGFRWDLALVLHSILVEASDGSSSSNYSSSVLDGFERVVVFVLLTATSNVRPSLTSQHYMGLIELLVVVCEAIVCRMGSGYGVRKPLILLLVRVGMCFDALGELFSDEPLSLRADSLGRPKLPGSDSRLNLVHLFAAS